MKRRLALLLILMLLFCCAACGQSGADEESFPRQETTVPEQTEEPVEVLPIGISGEVSVAMPFRGGYLAQSYDPQDETAAISLLDSEGQTLWTYQVDGHSEGMIPVGDSLILLKGMKREYTALDGEGRELWRRQVGDDYSIPEVFLPDNEGGVYALGRGMGLSYANYLRWHISAAGEVHGPEPYTIVPGCSALDNWVGEDGSNWVVCSTAGDQWRFVARLDENLHPVARFDLQPNQYLFEGFYPTSDPILLYGQAYRGSGAEGDWQEYGFLYEINEDCNLLHKETFEGRVPNSAAKLKDSRWIVSFYTRENVATAPVYLYSADWKQETEIPIDYGFASVTALEDGGFVIVGAKLAAGQPEAYLSMGSVRPKMDTIYSRFNAAGELLCDKIFYAKDSKSGYGVYVLVDTLGRVLVG